MVLEVKYRNDSFVSTLKTPGIVLEPPQHFTKFSWLIHQNTIIIELHRNPVPPSRSSMEHLPYVNHFVYISNHYKQTLVHFSTNTSTSLYVSPSSTTTQLHPSHPSSVTLYPSSEGFPQLPTWLYSIKGKTPFIIRRNYKSFRVYDHWRCSRRNSVSSNPHIQKCLSVLMCVSSLYTLKVLSVPLTLVINFNHNVYNPELNFLI